MNIISKYKSTILLFVLSSLWALHFSLVKLVEADNNPFSILVPLLLILCVLFFLVLKINNQTFSVEQGPKGGDELNRVEKDGNYGWPLSSYGTRYMIDRSGKSLPISHERSGFKEPMIALVPSVGISALSQCPKKLKNYYKKNCLIALSLYGNKLRKGRSLIIFLINDDLNQVNSVEQIYLGSLGKLRLRHFVTNSKNELFEDEEGNIYISADKKGIYRISFTNFRQF